MYQIAQNKRKSLVFCGHSLGGGIAMISTLSLLHSLNDPKDVHCITFGQPTVLSENLVIHLPSKWRDHFLIYVNDLDPIPKLCSPNALNGISSIFPNMRNFSPQFKSFGKVYKLDDRNCIEIDNDNVFLFFSQK
eukprot:TRINITY_DN7833_c0_g1_i1.p1 TRINITY_DN7833_c0_g1~~TRINITY_DN7833_c0_g1_i1.p1  ORF type:complete len:134 (-),score=24.11 TRINITY_DN7833_c0_g1_i1:51-452(-)